MRDSWTSVGEIAKTASLFPHAEARRALRLVRTVEPRPARSRRHLVLAVFLLGGGLGFLGGAVGALVLTEPVHRSLHDTAGRALVAQHRAEAELAAYRTKAMRTR